MSTLILVLFLLLLACMVLGAVAVTAVLLIHLWRWARRTDLYEPAAAEAPDPVARHYASVGDTFGFGDGPLFAAQVESMLRRAGEGVDVYDGAPKEQT